MTQVKAELQPAVHRVMQESMLILNTVFKAELDFAGDLVPQELAEDDSPAAQAYREVFAVAKLVDNQILMQLSPERAERQLEQLGLLGHSDEFITFDQQLLVSQAVIDVILRIGDGGDVMDQFAFFQEFHRRFNVSYYAQIPAARFDEVMSWIKSGS